MALFQGNIFPKTLGFETQVYVSLPYDGHRYQKDGPTKSLILLHGISDNASGWIRHGLADEFAARYNIAVIVPDGHKSFWLDMRHGGHYTEYLTGELPEMMGNMFHIPADPDHLMIAGLSMGGFGALHAALSEPGVFTAVGSFSGVTDIRAFFSEAERLGEVSDCGANFINEIAAIVGEGEQPGKERILAAWLKDLGRRKFLKFIWRAGQKTCWCISRIRHSIIYCANVIWMSCMKHGKAFMTGSSGAAR